MRIMPQKFALLFTALATLPVVAAKAQSQMEMNRQAEIEFEKADAELNAVYKKTLSGLDSIGKKKLQASEKAWLVYRDAEAAMQADEERGGSMAPMIYAEAETELTRQRIKALKKAQDGE